MVTRKREVEIPDGLMIGRDDLLLTKFPLWKVIRKVIRQTAEIRVFDFYSICRTSG
jgi:hypothetical protein